MSWWQKVCKECESSNHGVGELSKPCECSKDAICKLEIHDSKLPFILAYLKGELACENCKGWCDFVKGGVCIYELDDTPKKHPTDFCSKWQPKEKK